jgi:hypothetical protein
MCGQTAVDVECCTQDYAAAAGEGHLTLALKALKINVLHE